MTEQPVQPQQTAAHQTVKGRLLRGLGGQAVAQPVNILIQLATVPLLIVLWGPDLMGEWLILTAVPAYLVLSDLGFTTATINAMTMQVSGGKRDAALETFQSSWILITAMSLAVAGIGATVAWLAPLGDWFNFAMLDNTDAALVLTMQLLMVVCGLQSGLMNAGLVSIGAYGLGATALSLFRLADFGLLALIAGLGYGPVTVAAAMLCSQATCLVSIRLLVRRHAPWVKIGVRHATKATFRATARPAMGYIAITLGQALNLQGMVIMVGVVLSPAAVTVFNVLRMLTRVTTSVLNAFHGTLRPEISIAHGKKDTAMERRLHAAALQIAVWAVGIATIGMALLGPWFVDLWTNGEVAVRFDLFSGLLVAMVAYAIWFASAMVMYATNRNRRMAAYYVAVNALSLAAAWPLIEWLDLAGAGIAAAVAEVLMVLHVLPATMRMLNEHTGTLLRAVARPPTDLLRHLRRSPPPPPPASAPTTTAPTTTAER